MADPAVEEVVVVGSRYGPLVPYYEWDVQLANEIVDMSKYTYDPEQSTSTLNIYYAKTETEEQKEKDVINKITGPLEFLHDNMSWMFSAKQLAALVKVGGSLKELELAIDAH